MIQTADLTRSKKLASLGWEQKDSTFYWVKDNKEHTSYEYDWECVPTGTYDWGDYPEYAGFKHKFSAPTAGEMIEWLLTKCLNVILNSTRVEIEFLNHNEILKYESFQIKEGLCNALADAVIWVLESEK